MGAVRHADGDLAAYAEPWIARTTVHQTRGQDGVTELFDVDRGVDQGCALSPLLFPLAVHDGLVALQRRAREHDPSASVVAFQDDVFLLADPALFAMVPDWLRFSFAVAGLTPKESKCKAWGDAARSRATPFQEVAAPRVVKAQVPIPRGADGVVSVQAELAFTAAGVLGPPRGVAEGRLEGADCGGFVEAALQFGFRLLAPKTPKPRFTWWYISNASSNLIISN